MKTPRRRISVSIKTGKKTGRNNYSKAVKRTIIPSTLRRGSKVQGGY